MDNLTNNIDLYELLDILSSATTQEVKKAYRKKALKCHPDKNPDNPKAADLFHQLSRALEILTDVSARAAYDKVLNAKNAALLRNKELDSKRKKMKEDLEAREKQAQYDVFQEKSAEEKLKAEIERLRKEGSKQLEEEIEFVRKQVEKERFNSSEQEEPSLFRLKITWKVENNGTTNKIYNHDSLNKIFSKYGDISALVVSNKKKSSALLEFTSPKDAVKAQLLEKGFLSNPLTVSWLSGTPPSSIHLHSEPVRGKMSTASVDGATTFPAMPKDNVIPTQRRAFPCFPPAPDISAKNKQVKHDPDFETIVLSRMRAAEEDKRKAADKECEETKS